MQKYPFSPEILDAMPERLAELYRKLELKLLDEICTRLDFGGVLNEATIQDIRALRSHGISLTDIKKAIAETTKTSRKELDKLFDDVVDRNQRYYTDVVDAMQITKPQYIISDIDIEAIRRQTWNSFRNLSTSMGFLVVRGGKLTLLPPAEAYWSAVDNAEMQIRSGAISYNQAITTAVKELADSGLRVVEYESKDPEKRGTVDHYTQLDVAVRRAVLTGINQLCDKYTSASAEKLGTRYFEISAHGGARDIPYPNQWSSHKDWQGKVYYESEQGESDPLGKYDDLHDSTGYGEVDGLLGANCRHHRFPFFEGFSERTYTDGQLKTIDDKLECEFEGKKYTAYQATQKQRQIERTIRKLTREKTAYQANSETQDKALEIGAKIQRMKKEYKKFCAAANLREQAERMKVLYD